MNINVSCNLSLRHFDKRDEKRHTFVFMYVFICSSGSGEGLIRSGRGKTVLYLHFVEKDKHKGDKKGLSRHLLDHNLYPYPTLNSYYLPPFVLCVTYLSG